MIWGTFLGKGLVRSLMPYLIKGSLRSFLKQGVPVAKLLGPRQVNPSAMPDFVLPHNLKATGSAFKG